MVQLDISMPESCSKCLLCTEDLNTNNSMCRITKRNVNEYTQTNERPPECPLKDIPEQKHFNKWDEYINKELCSELADGYSRVDYNKGIDDMYHAIQRVMLDKSEQFPDAFSMREIVNAFMLFNPMNILKRYTAEQFMNKVKLLDIAHKHKEE